MKENQNHNIPFQVETIIQSMMNKTERHHVRENYKLRLEAIRDVIDKSIKRYNEDTWMGSSNLRKKK